MRNVSGPARLFFGDKRLDDRLFNTFDRMASRPQGTLPKKLLKRGPLVGGYRMLNNSKVTHAAIVHAHRDRCLAQLREVVAAGGPCKVLLLHDTTVLDYSGLDVAGLGQVGDGHGRGLYGHHSLAVIPRTRQVAGLFNQILHKRAKVPKGETKSQRAARADRESRLWKQAAVDVPLSLMPPGVTVTDVSDRGSDITEYIDHEIGAGREFIVRSMHNRKLAEQDKQDDADQGDAERIDTADPQVQKLHGRLRGLASMGHYTLRVPAKEGGWREATIHLAYAALSILPPRQARGEHGQEPLNLFGVIACETDVPAKETPVEWMLLSNRAIKSIEAAREVVEDYACRWMVEDYHKAQKTGCGIEETQLTTRHALDNFIALTSVLAVHVLRLRCKARDEQIREQPARLHEDELKVQLAAQDSKNPDWRQMTVWEFFIAVARMGGYVLNPNKTPPGWITLWRGYTRLEEMCEGVRLWQKRCVQT